MSQVVYVYEGLGAAFTSSNLLLSSLRQCLCPAAYSIQRITAQQIKTGDWVDRCAAVVFGGGYDLGFLNSLGEEGVEEIRRYVLGGGSYLGVCAGAYFACDYIQFEKGTKMEVSGYRPLKFYPGQCQGSVAPNFSYNSQRGAAVLPITITPHTIPRLDRDTTLHAYVNGGGCFSPYPSREEFPDIQSLETLARFESLDGAPEAVVRCEVGMEGGVAVLSSPHVEFSAFELNPTDLYLMPLQRALRNSDRLREAFFRSLLEKANLRLRPRALL
ncbi:hypothetical protein ACOMHN_001282 [Nucella lapillus]